MFLGTFFGPLYVTFLTLGIFLTVEVGIWIRFSSMMSPAWSWSVILTDFFEVSISGCED